MVSSPTDRAQRAALRQPGQSPPRAQSRTPLGTDGVKVQVSMRYKSDRLVGVMTGTRIEAYQQAVQTYAAMQRRLPTIARAPRPIRVEAVVLPAKSVEGTLRLTPRQREGRGAHRPGLYERPDRGAAGAHRGHRRQSCRQHPGATRVERTRTGRRVGGPARPAQSARRSLSLRNARNRDRYYPSWAPETCMPSYMLTRTSARSTRGSVVAVDRVDRRSTSHGGGESQGISGPDPFRALRKPSRLSPCQPQPCSGTTPAAGWPARWGW